MFIYLLCIGSGQYRGCIGQRINELDTCCLTALNSWRNGNYADFQILIQSNYSGPNIIGCMEQLLLNSSIQPYANQKLDVTSLKLLPEDLLNAFAPICTKGDGNCFYRAVSFNLFGTEQYHSIIRAALLLDILNNESGYTNFLDISESGQTYEELLNDVQTLQREAENGALYGMAKVICRPIDIYQDATNGNHMRYLIETTYVTIQTKHCIFIYFIFRYVFNDDHSQRQPVSMHFRGPGDGPNNHFVAMLPVKDVPHTMPLDYYINFRNYGL